jgi:3-hydroxybutyryl-CoA dehydrogenase
MPRERIACLGAGRMGRGIAVVFAYAGHPVTIVDFKPRALRAVRRRQG